MFLEPEQIKAMRSAFKKVSEALKFDYHPNDPMTDLIVTKITERVNDGEIDPDRITDQVLIEIRRLYSGLEEHGRKGILRRVREQRRAERRAPEGAAVA